MASRRELTIDIPIELSKRLERLAQALCRLEPNRTWTPTQLVRLVLQRGISTLEREAEEAQQSL